MGKHLDNLLACDHFFHIAVNGTEGFLLADEEFACFAHHRDGHEHDAGNGEHGYDGQNPGSPQHGGENHDDGDDGRECLRNGLGNHLTQGIDVAGIAGHDVACGVGVEIAQGKPLHLGKHLVTDGLLGALGDGNHQILLQECGNHTGGEDCADADQVFCQRCKIRRTGSNHGQDELIHQIADVLAAAGGSDGGNDNAYQHSQQIGNVLLHVAQKPQERLFGILGLAAILAEFYGRHYSSPPFCWE